MASKNKNNRTGFLFIFIIIILLLVIIYAYRDKFQIFFKTEFSKLNNFSGLDFKNVFNNKKEKNKKINITDTIKMIDKKENKEKIERKIEEKKELSKKENILKDGKKDLKIVNNVNNNKIETKNDVFINKKQEKFQKEVENSTKSISNKENKELKKRISKIYFTMLDEKDNLVLKSVTREISYYNTPLTETLKELFNGPNNKELSSNYITNIPKGSKILRTWIKDGILYLDLSSEFENNNYGRESTINQLKQIVFTATEFPNVQRVQFLINGREEKYLGGEGIFIGKPLGRSDF
ncbi:MAG TPA: GerMN domain-containing protein [Spirochaetota bacterium]|nr:GerMN domain-containing protein [Spirochaetota bacterium]HOL56596.1 GerMN domain-containing protein [Spirochaetota bacterium]HPP04019.1 GerMN domain-containing protein [Spirochaetota bacterium]